MKKIQILLGICVIGVAFLWYMALFGSSNFRTIDGTAKAFTKALIAEDYESAGEIYPVETPRQLQESTYYMLGSLSSYFVPPYTITDLMNAMHGVQSNTINRYSSNNTIYLLPNYTQTENEDGIGYINSENKVRVIRLYFYRLDKKYYVDRAELIYVDQSLLNNTSKT